jgi:hypothetical protein
MRGKIRLVYRMAAHNGQHVIVLGKSWSFHYDSDRFEYTRQVRWVVAPTLARLVKLLKK